MNKVDKLALQIVSDPAVKSKMKDYIGRVRPDWSLNDHPIMLATQAALAKKELEKEFLERARKVFASDREFRAWKNSPNYNMDKFIGLRDMERMKGFSGFDDETTAHMDGVGEMFFDAYESFTGKKTLSKLQKSKVGKLASSKLGKTVLGAAGVGAGPLGIGLAVGKGALQVGKKLQQIHRANKEKKKQQAAAQTAFQAQNTKAEPVRDAIEYVGQAGVNDLERKKQSYDRMRQNQYAADLATAENNALAAGVSPKYIDKAKQSAGSADAMVEGINKLTTAVSDQGQEVAKPGSSNTPIILIAAVALGAFLIMN